MVSMGEPWHGAAGSGQAFDGRRIGMGNVRNEGRKEGRGRGRQVTRRVPPKKIGFITRTEPSHGWNEACTADGSEVCGCDVVVMGGGDGCGGGGDGRVCGGGDVCVCGGGVCMWWWWWWWMSKPTTPPGSLDECG